MVTLSAGCQDAFLPSGNTGPATDDADRELERCIAGLLAGRHVPALRQVRVTATQGTVTLRGRVRSFYEKQICQNISRHVPGVARLVDAVIVA